MDIKEIRQLTNLSQKKFCEKYGIPLQTLCKWEQGHRTCPDYVAELLEFKVMEDLKMDKISNEVLQRIEEENKKQKEMILGENSCKLCGTDYDFRMVQINKCLNHMGVSLSGSIYQVNNSNRFKYCPECGRKLTKENFGDKEF